MTARATWKGFERRLAECLNGKRIPVTGMDRHGADVVTPMFCIQAKLRKGQPSYLREWLDGICLTALASNRIGVVIWKTPGRGKPDDDALVVMRLKDFEALHGTAHTGEPA